MPSVTDLKNLKNLASGANPAGLVMNLATSKQGQKVMGGCCLAGVAAIVIIIAAIGSVIYSQGHIDNSIGERPTDFAGATGSSGLATGPINEAVVRCIVQNSNNKISTELAQSLTTKRTVYEAGAIKFNLPWDVLAAIHYRESGTRTDLNNPFQVNGYNGTFSAQAAEVAAGSLVSLTKNVYGLDLKTSQSDSALKFAFLAYNRGAMYQRAGLLPDDSPYVMNYFDPARSPMRWPNNPTAEPSLTRGKIDSNLGAFTFLVILRRCSSGGDRA